MPQGKVKWFSAEKAFGFIEQDPDNDIFVHVTGLAHGVTTLEKDQLVEYETEQGRKGPQAANVRPVAAAPAAEEAAPAAEAVEDEEVEAVEDEEVEADEDEEVEADVEIVEVEEETAPDAE